MSIGKARGLVLAMAGLALLAGPAAWAQGGALGIYIYEHIEGYHRVASTAGTEITSALLTTFDRVMAHDGIPLESNETVRILDEMTKDREVVITTITTWLRGEVIAAPTIKFKDDAIKFKDLTWHVDQDAVLEHAREQKLDHVLIGSISGLVNAVKSASSGSGRQLYSVQAVANLRLLDLEKGATLWAKTYRETQTGFDARSVFESLAAAVGEQAGVDINAQLTQ